MAYPKKAGLSGGFKGSKKRGFSNGHKRFSNTDEEFSVNTKKSRQNGVNKHGRRQLREITKVGRRAPQTEEDIEEVEEVDEEQLEDNENQNGSGADGTNDYRQAYNALMVLLKPGEEEEGLKKQHKKKTKDVGEDHEQMEFDIEEEDEAAELDQTKKEDLEDEQEMYEDEDGDDSDNEEGSKGPGNSFEYHFASPAEKTLEDAENLMSKEPKTKWVAKRQNIAGYSINEQVPPNGLQLGGFGDDEYRMSSNFTTYHVKSKILNAFTDKYPSLTLSQKLIAEPVLQYKDMVFPYQDYANESSVRDMYVLHCTNHILKTRDRILKNNMKLSSFKESLESGAADVSEEPELRDQSFNRPKVLILLPTRHSCYQVVEKIIETSQLTTVENKRKFTGQFHSDAEVPEYKPEDFKYLFNGNSNDFFCLGVKFTRKTLKLYSAFNQSDVILASPLGLKSILEKKEKNKKNKEFLSSIEILIVDQANSLQYQNWANVSYIIKHVNKIPEDYSDDLDFSRIRMWAINNQFKYLRQNLVFCKFPTPEINNLINNAHSLNLSGKVKFKKLFGKGQTGPAIDKIVFGVKQTFQRFFSELPMSDPDSRFNFFKTNIVPQLNEQSEDREEGGTLVYVPDYSDYLRVKNYLRFETSINFCSIDEYSSQAKLARYRDGFSRNKYKVMLYTERLHHYNRFEIRGVKNVVFYKLSADESYYAEVVLRFLGHSLMKEIIKDIRLSSVKVMFSQWDAPSLERVVGQEKVPLLCFGTNEIYEFK